MQAIAGEAVYMPCDISTPEQGDSVVLVLWYREDLGTPIYRQVYARGMRSCIGEMHRHLLLETNDVGNECVLPDL
ncbi:hypothetical protein B566_EDAN004879 [Ephemera danica]|nr:hypothetical protein B566_EDAN004879 [Ephemera danica]